MEEQLSTSISKHTIINNFFILLQIMEFDKDTDWNKYQLVGLSFEVATNKDEFHLN